MQDWKRRNRLELRIILREIVRKRDPSRRYNGDEIDLNRFFKRQVMAPGKLVWDTPHPIDGGPHLDSGITYANLRAFGEAVAAAIGDREIVDFCDDWVEGERVWDAIANLPTFAPVGAAPKDSRRTSEPSSSPELETTIDDAPSARELRTEETKAKHLEWDRSVVETWGANLHKSHGWATNKVAKEFGANSGTVRRWVRRAYEMRADAVKHKAKLDDAKKRAR